MNPPEPDCRPSYRWTRDFRIVRVPCEPPRAS